MSEASERICRNCANYRGNWCNEWYRGVAPDMEACTAFLDYRGGGNGRPFKPLFTVRIEGEEAKEMPPAIQRDKAQQIVELRQQGKSLLEVAKETGLSLNTVRKYSKQDASLPDEQNADELIARIKRLEEALVALARDLQQHQHLPDGLAILPSAIGEPPYLRGVMNS